MSTSRENSAGERFADPIASANLYAAGRLDEAYAGVVAPLRERLAPWSDEGAYLWTMRYAKGGEHLKLRVHAPAEREREAHAHLAAVCEEWLSRLPPSDDGEPRHSRPDAPPIDVEDRVQEDHPDRTWLRTSYVASQVALGGEPFLGQPEYRARLTRALASGCDVVLAALEDGALSHAQRQRTLLQALIVGLAGAGLGRERVAGYLVYHRDWLIRFPLLKRGGDPATAGRAVARIEEQAERMTSLREALRALVDETWESGPASTAAAAGGELPADDWCRALAQVVEHAERFDGDPDFRIDPFAGDVAYPPLFKAIHGLGNQLGLRGLDEALAHHLVLRATLDDVSPHLSIDLLPGERGGESVARS